MKRRSALFPIIIAVTVFSFLLLSSGCSKSIKDENGLLEKAREEIPISDFENTEIIIAGVSENEGAVLIWFISGNEYQEHYYLPIEFKVSDDSSYTFTKTYLPMNRGIDIAALHWKGGLSVVINNPNCCILRITDGSGTHAVSITEYPYVFYSPDPIATYVFLDKYGNEI